MNNHPLVDLHPNNYHLDSERYEQYIPRYFKQRLALSHLHISSTPQNQIVEQVTLEDEAINDLKLSGINYRDFKNQP